MNEASVREHLHDQIDNLPDDILRQVADFASFVIERRQSAPRYAAWTDQEWDDFSLAQFFREEDEVTYTLEDAQEVYRP